jgi:uncharacterized protein YceH (UPF0502 family)
MPAIDRRIFGVLIEKGKTTPDQYPMSLNALTAGCNQKSNRYPQMDLDQEDVLRGLDRLRMLGAVAEVQGGGRVPRYRHFAYEWLGVNKVELAVMAELLLRGSQSEGELRGRAARMEPIADVAGLRPVLDSLESKRLVVSLTSAGRGHMVTHNLYEPQEMEKQRSLHSGGEHDEANWESDREGETGKTVASASVTSPRDASFTRAAAEGSHSLEKELQSLRSEIAQLKSELAELAAAHERTTDELRSMRDALGG